MEHKYTTERLIEKLQNDVIGKWHKEGRVGNDGSAGNTLEDLLGVEENNLMLPDWGHIELKTKKKEGTSLVTLMHREPKPAASVPSLLLSLGWKHQSAGVKYGPNELSFRSTTRANEFSDRGFSLQLCDDRITFVFDPQNVNVTARDRTGNYETYGDWLEDVQKRIPHHSQVLPVFWEKQFVLSEIKNKLDHTLFVTVSTKRIDGIRYFKYDTAALLSGFMPDKLYELFESKALYVDFDARTNHNHGTKFRVDVRKITELFSHSKLVF